MFAICLDTSSLTNVAFSALSDCLLTYGISDIIPANNSDSLTKIVQDYCKPQAEVLLIGTPQRIFHSLIRRLTLSTTRLPSLVAVWDGTTEDELVAARLPWEPVRQAWLNDTTSDLRDAARKASKTFATASFTVQSFISGEATRIGGSFAKSGVQRYFRKQASGLGSIKLGDEMNFYRSLPEHLRGHYPTLLFSSRDEHGVSFGIDYKQVPNLRDLLLNCDISASQAASALKQVLQYEYGQAYMGHLVPTPPNYLEDYHFHRVWRRMQISCDLDPTFVDLISAEWLVINGKRMPNIPTMLYVLENSSAAKKILVPEYVSPYVHSDLHLENILVDRQNNTIWLVDPRGYPVCDIYYDLGKLTHSYNSNYDLLHEGRHETSLRFETDSSSCVKTAIVDFTFVATKLTALYAELNELMRTVTYETLGAKTDEEKKMVDIRVLFNEAMHLCSDMPFHINKNSKPNVAFPIYATGAKLLAEVLEMLGIDPMGCSGSGVADIALERLRDMGTKKWAFEA
ncbi:hypothetical protein D9758_015725 [Tetrapyrgos nigripes]|uniref:Aminoglycoside phosphotransferase domain-containing protein n=1 Tax=Tetrapyrgos nigripes TaxID=182062 RepID=A0A8H5CRR9_9AGAR|nr:hypothetical protein D9758_015725 [Tetrapyrgos nigripes]